MNTTLSLPLRLQVGLRRLQEKRMAQGYGMPRLNELYLEGIEGLLVREGIDLSQIDAEIAGWSSQKPAVRRFRGNPRDPNTQSG